MSFPSGLDWEVDVVVLGSGFAGSLLAAALRKQGRRVLMVERSQHPRFAIGESSTPLTNLLLEEFARKHELPEVVPLVKWGSWQETYPQLGCGLKRGFSFYHHEWDQHFQDTQSHRNQLLVAASPHDAIADTHWYRPDFDLHLLQVARSRGVDYLDRTEIRQVHPQQGEVVVLEGVREGRSIRVGARLVVDATGTRGCLSRLLDCGESRFEGYPLTETVFAHFRNVGRVSDLPEVHCGDTPPYPPDDAALHHLFPGGWIWVLRFNNGLVSAGAALLPEWADRVRDPAGNPCWNRLLEHLPTVRRQFVDAEPVTPLLTQRPMPFLSARCNGPGWVMLPSAMGFVDPLLSTGFPLVLFGLNRLVETIGARWGQPGLDEDLAADVQRSRSELNRVARLIGALYGSLNDFPRFATLSRLYFAAVSFAESARRLGRRELAGDSFLLGNHPAFVEGVESCLRDAASLSVEELERRVDALIDPVDVAGLTRRDRAHWLPVDAGDLLAAAHKLHATPEEIEQVLRNSGFYAHHAARG